VPEFGIKKIEKILSWIEWKNIDNQYDLFDEKKFSNYPRFDSILNK
jgi:hypothetical protein